MDRRGLSTPLTERRRRWSDEERLQIVAEAFAPGARVADVCRRHDVSSGLIYTWRRKLLDAGVAQETSAPEALPTPMFLEAVMDDDPAAAASYGEHPAMIIDLPRGKRLSVFAAASPALARALSQDLRDRVVAATDDGMSCRAAAARFGVGVATAIRWRQMARERDRHGRADGP